MNEWFYRAMREAGGGVFRLASDARVLHSERAARAGSYILAANHTSPYDPALLIAATPRIIHWLSVVELFRNPLIGQFLRALGAEPLDRSRVDLQTLRAVLRHLHSGRVVGIFPEGGVKTDGHSVLANGTLHTGVCRLAHLANVPVLPCAIVGSGKFACWTSWLPAARTRWAVAFGDPIFPVAALGREAGRAALREELVGALRGLREELADHI